MDFKLSKEHLMVQKMAKEFAEKEIKPLAQIIDEEERFPVETIPKLAKYGIFGAAYSVEYGGEGGDYMSYVIALEEIAKVCGATAGLTSTHASVGIYCIQLFGTEEQKRFYMPLLMKGGKMMGFCLTEPGVGTDASGIQTKAVKDGDNYIINGTKMFISSAGYNDYYIVLTMTDKSKGVKGITAFIISKDNPGLKVGKHEKKMGIRGSVTAEVILENCVVSKNDMLGAEGKGFKIALTSLDSGRIGMGTQALGIAQGAIDETIKYVKERKQFGKRISEFQNTQFVLADLQTKVDAGRLLIWRAAMLKDAGENFSQEASMAKLYCSEIANETTRKCVQLFGGYGYTREYPVERMMRDAKITEIYEGTSEAQKMVISRNMKVF